MKNTPVLVCASLLILTIFAGFFYYRVGLFQFDPDYKEYLGLFECSLDLSSYTDKLFYLVANLVNRAGGSYSSFRVVVLFISVLLTLISIPIWGKRFQAQHIGSIFFVPLFFSILFFVIENYFVRIRIGMAEPLMSLALAVIFYITHGAIPTARHKWVLGLVSLFLLLMVAFIHLQAFLLVISVALFLMCLLRYEKKISIALAISMGIGLTVLVDWRSQFRNDLLYSQYNIARYLILNAGQLLLVLMAMKLKPRLQKLNYFDLFLMFYTGISIGIALLFVVHPVLISGEALVRFQSAYALVAILGVLYASQRMNLVWLYILLINGAFFINGFIAPFFDVKKLLT